MLRPAVPETSTIWLEDRIRDATDSRPSRPAREHPGRRRVLLAVPKRWARTLVALRLASVPNDLRRSAGP